MSKWSKPYRKVGVMAKLTEALRRTPWLSTRILNARLGHSCGERLNEMRRAGLVESRIGDGNDNEWRLRAAGN